MKTIDEVIEAQKKFDEEIAVKDSIHILNEYCKKHKCDDCYLKLKFDLYMPENVINKNNCLFMQLINFFEG